MAPRSKSLQEHINKVRAWNIDAGHFDPENYVTDWCDSEQNRELAVALVSEEVDEMGEAVVELAGAVRRDVMDPNDPWVEAEILDAAADIMFTLFGLVTKAGLADYLEPVFVEVCKSNDTKLIDPVVKPNGKIGKNPKHFREPDIKGILTRG